MISRRRESGGARYKARERNLMGEETFFSLKGQIAIVTGGAQGIGEAIAGRLTSAGARVAIFDLNEPQAKTVAGSLGGVGVKCDVSSAASVENAVREVRRQLGPIDIVVNNAGITGKTAALWELDERDLDQVNAVNLKRSEEHTSELQSRLHLVCRLLLEKKKESGLQTHELL